MLLKVLGSSSKGNSYLLVSEEETLILECGIKYKDILKGLDFNTSKVIAALITHEHQDHSKAIKDILKTGIDIYASKGTLEACGATGYRRHIIKAEEQFKVGGFTILALEAQHDAAEPLAFLIQHKEGHKIAFITDSYYCRYKFSNLNYIMIECNYSEEILDENVRNGYIPKALEKRLRKSHFSLENVKGFLKANDLSKVKEIVLLHLSDGNSNAELFKTEIEKLTGKPVYIADGGLNLYL